MAPSKPGNLGIAPPPDSIKDPPTFQPEMASLYLEQVIDRLMLAHKNNQGAFVGACTRVLRIAQPDVEARVEAVKGWRARLQELLADPGITQRTPEWYAARDTLITASDFAQSLGSGKFGTQRGFFQKKCGLPEEQTPIDFSIAPLKWGCMFEPVAQDVYSLQNMGVKVHEFGLLRHPTIPYLGASPDGVTDLGVMLEIKCPWRRKIIEGEVPMQYYYQIQGQLEVAGLDECDYFECSFTEVEYGPASEDWCSAPKGERGVILELKPAEQTDTTTPPEYIYSSADDGDSCGDGTTPPYVEWVEKMQEDAVAKGSVVIQHWWLVKQTATTRVKRDPRFCATMLGRLAVVWDAVIGFRNDRDKYIREVGAAEPAAKRPKPDWVPPDEVEVISSFGSGYAFVD